MNDEELKLIISLMKRRFKEIEVFEKVNKTSNKEDLVEYLLDDNIYIRELTERKLKELDINE